MMKYYVISWRKGNIGERKRYSPRSTFRKGNRCSRRLRGRCDRYRPIDRWKGSDRYRLRDRRRGSDRYRLRDRRSGDRDCDRSTHRLSGSDRDCDRYTHTLRVNAWCRLSDGDIGMGHRLGWLHKYALKFISQRIVIIAIIASFAIIAIIAVITTAIQMNCRIIFCLLICALLWDGEWCKQILEHFCGFFVLFLEILYCSRSFCLSFIFCVQCLVHCILMFFPATYIQGYLEAVKRVISSECSPIITFCCLQITVDSLVPADIVAW
jgi:hypothetical protein